MKKIEEAIIKYQKLSEEAENNAASYAHIEKFKRELKHNTEARYCELSKEECLASATEYRQLAKWLKELKAYRNMYRAENVNNCLREKVADNGNDD